MEQLVAHNIFPSQFPEALRHLEFPWVKVEDRPWANGGFKVRVLRITFYTRCHPICRYSFCVYCDL